jgi:hypothetical protein
VGWRIIVQQEKISRAEILSQNSKNCNLGGVQRFCYNSWCVSVVIFYYISSSSRNVYLSSSRFWTVTSPVIFYQLPSLSKSNYLITFDRFGASHSHKPFAPILMFLSQIDWLWNKIFWQLCFFAPSMTYKETDFTRQVKILTLSKINETRVNGSWLIVFSGLADRSLWLCLKEISPKTYGPHCVCVWYDGR